VFLGLVVALASTTGIGIGNSWFDEQRILLLVTVGLVVVVSLFTRQDFASGSAFAIVVVLTLGLVSALVAARPYAAALEWSVFCLLLFAVLSVRLASTRLIAVSASIVLACIAATYSTGVLTNFVSSLILGFPLGPETLLVGFSNSRFPAQLQALTLPLLPIAHALAPSRLWRSVLVVVGVMWWTCLIGSGSRTSWLAMMSATLVVLAASAGGRRWAWLQVRYFAAGLALWFIAFFVIPAVMGIPAEPEVNRLSLSSPTRLFLWENSLWTALEHPLLGIGPMHFAYSGNDVAAHPHNLWLQLAAEWGVPAMLLLLVLAVALFVKLFNSVRAQTSPQEQDLGAALLAAYSVWCIGNLADGFMVIPTSQAASLIILILAIGWVRCQGRLDSPRHMLRYAPQVLRAQAVVALGVLLALPFSNFGSPTERELAWRAENPTSLFLPRFWQQGWIGPDQDPTAR
jgi:putative inorganic carbon (hco3(-)) transporter